MAWYKRAATKAFDIACSPESDQKWKITELASNDVTLFREICGKKVILNHFGKAKEGPKIKIRYFIVSNLT